MKIEIEAKMAVQDEPGLLRRLAELRAVPDAVVVEVNTYFDNAQWSLKTGDQGLRLRVARPEGEGAATATLTHKGPRAHGQLKSRWETEVEVADAAAAGELLTALGFQSVFGFEKRRRTWHLEGCQIALDELPHLGRFVEIEGPSEEAVMHVRDRLGLTGVPLLHASYISMLTTYLADRHLSAEFLGLEENEKAEVRSEK